MHNGTFVSPIGQLNLPNGNREMSHRRMFQTWLVPVRFLLAFSLLEAFRFGGPDLAWVAALLVASPLAETFRFGGPDLAWVATNLVASLLAESFRFGGPDLAWVAACLVASPSSETFRFGGPDLTWVTTFLTFSFGGPSESFLTLPAGGMPLLRGCHSPMHAADLCRSTTHLLPPTTASQVRPLS